MVRDRCDFVVFLLVVSSTAMLAVGWPKTWFILCRKFTLDEDDVIPSLFPYTHIHW